MALHSLSSFCHELSNVQLKAGVLQLGFPVKPDMELWLIWKCNVNEKETFVVLSAASPSLSSLTHAKSMPSGMELPINKTFVGTNTVNDQ